MPWRVVIGRPAESVRAGHGIERNRAQSAPGIVLGGETQGHRIARRKRIGGSYAASGGLHGVGVSVVNALSETLEVQVARDQQLYRMVFSRGEPQTKLEKLGSIMNRRGTKVRFRPDEKIFGKGAAFKPARVMKMARSKAYLFRGVNIRWSASSGVVLSASFAHSDANGLSSVEADIARSYQRITQAPLVIVVFVDMSEMDRYPDDTRNEAEYLMAVQSTAMATQNLLLAAQAEGLGASIMCAPLFCPCIVAASLNVPAGWRAQMLLTIGVPGAPSRERPRKPLDQIARGFPQDDLARR